MPVAGGCKPYQTTLMKMNGIDWMNYNGTWYMVCSFCGGNCGQCGNTGYTDDVPAQMQVMIDHLGVNQNAKSL